MTSISVQRGRMCKNISVVSTSHIRDLLNVADPFQRKGLIALNASLAFPQICDGIENIFINWNRSMAQWWISLLRRGCSGQRWSLKIRLHSQILVLDPFAMLLLSWHFSLSRSQPRCRITILIRGKDDFKILYNDWPYGVDTDIIHLVIWTKFQLEEDPATGDLTEAMREKIEDYIQRTFCGRISRENVCFDNIWVHTRRY